MVNSYPNRFKYGLEELETLSNHIDLYFFLKLITFRTLSFACRLSKSKPLSIPNTKESLFMACK